MNIPKLNQEFIDAINSVLERNGMRTLESDYVESTRIEIEIGRPPVIVQRRRCVKDSKKEFIDFLSGKSEND